jgi:4-hydroxybenzoate polyprenyltransferase
LKLVRFPLFGTALADSATGYLLTVRTGAEVEAGTLLLLGAASAFLYCGGMAMNDWADRERDRLLHPGRPLPSGALRPGTAAALGIVLLLAGAGCAAAIGANPAGTAAATAVMILAYDLLLKRVRLIGPPAMGLVRAGNLLMGMSAGRPVAELSKWELAWAGLLFLYVTLATLLSTFEEGRAPRLLLAAILAAAAAIFVAPALLAASLVPERVAFAAIPVAVLGWRAVVLARRPTSAEISATVGVLILGIIPLDASFLLAHGLPLASLAILWLLPFSLLGLWSFKRV